MKLAGNIRIVYGEEIITEESLDATRKRLGRVTLLPGIGSHKRTDRELFHAVLFESVPVEIQGVDGGETVLEAEFKRFPYSIDGKEHFASFGLRLVPFQGRVASVRYEGSMSPALNRLSVDATCFQVDFGNGNIHLEVYFLGMLAARLPELKPPAGFEREIWTRRRNDDVIGL